MTPERSPSAALAAFALLVALGPSTIVFGAPVTGFRPTPGASPEPIERAAGLESAQELEIFLDGVMADQLRTHGIAGATVAVVKDGEVFFAKGYGYADLEKRIPVDAQRTLFRPGSISKLFTWTAVMQLVEQGRLDLDTDVNTYLTAFQIPDTFAEPITLRNLMTHTPGLEDGGLGYLFRRSSDDLEGLAATLQEHLPARVRPPTTDFSSGGNASYSNWGTALAGHIVAEVSGLSFDAYIDQNILQPLGMTRSTFREPLPDALAGGMSVGYKHEKGVFEPQEFEYVHDFGPAGALSSTAADMAKFMIAHLNEGAYGDGRILARETARLMHGRVLSPHPNLSGSGLGFYESRINGRRIIGHGGDTLWFHSDLALLPEENVGLFVSYNSAEGPKGRRPLVEAFMDRYYPARLPRVKPPDDFAERAPRYAGSYRFTRHSYTRNEKFLSLLGGIKVAPTPDDTLLITGLGEKPTQWVEVGRNVFRGVDNDRMIAFAEDEDGRITHLLNPVGLAFIPAYKLAWYQSSDLHFFILGFGALCFLVAVVSALRNWRKDRAGTANARRGRRLAALAGMVNLLFLIGLAVTFASTELGDLIFGWPTGFRVALALPLIALPLTAGVLYFAVKVWRGREWGLYGRLQYTVIALACVAFLWSLNHWNLIGYKFG